MTQFDWTMPDIVKALHRLKFDYDHGNGMDFEPFQNFLSEEETREWIYAWTGNPTLDGKEYRIFGQDGSGGYAMFWCVRPNATLLEQPIVFFGSEGDVGVLASSFADYLWLLAGGLGPCEIVNRRQSRSSSHPEFTAFAIAHAAANQALPSEILAKARVEFPNFEESIECEP
jgi:hypothetical protein